jgi:hypothetical protein
MLSVELLEPAEKTLTQKLVEKLDEQHSNAIPIFGVAIWIDGVEELVACLPNLISDAKFWRWHDTPANACRTLCRLCFIDPTLIECYIGMKFEELVA